MLFSLTTMQRIVFVERNTFNIDFPHPSFPHEWVEFGETAPDQIVSRLSDASIVICNKLQLRRDVISKLPNLKLIAVAATGVDNIDLESCRERGVAVCNTRGYATTSVPEHILMFMLALRRNLISYHDDVRRGAWQDARQFCLIGYPINDLKGATLGIVGHGQIGKALENLALALGMKVLVAEHKGTNTIRHGRTPFTEVLTSSDVISLNCPLNVETKNLIGAAELKLMKTSSILINTARGGLVDDVALLNALEQRQIAGAGIDVLRNEPPADGSLLVAAKYPNLIVTPHNAWASRQAMEQLAEQLIANLEAFVRGEPQNLVT
jgi:glycerate dehydrogenase